MPLGALFGGHPPSVGRAGLAVGGRRGRHPAPTSATLVAPHVPRRSSSACPKMPASTVIELAARGLAEDGPSVFVGELSDDGDG